MASIVFSLCIVSLFIDFRFCTSLNQSLAIDYRLNTDIQPIDYIIDLTPYFDNDKTPLKFDGITTITIKTNKTNTDIITVHKQDLDIMDVSVTKKPGFFSPFPWKIEHIDVKSKEYDNITHKYTIKLVSPLINDETYDLNFKFTGNFRNDMSGFYRSSYKDGNITKWILTTQFEPISARKVFPCFDEARFKSTFSIIINRPAHFKPSLSNTAITSSYFTSSNSVREYFEKTPKMSTYLVAIVISELECRANPSKNFFVCSRPSAYDQTEYSLNVGQQLLAEYEEILDYNYSKHMSKMTLAAIPDFEEAAMENFGLLIYRESSLLFDPKASTAYDQQEILKIIAHELSHMWFGNLVTCDWWSNVWLQEGFAQFFEYFGAAMIESDWGLEYQFVVNEMQHIFVEDSLTSSLSLSHDANTPEEIQYKFGALSYYKGAAVIRMIQHMLGDENFIYGLRKYLKNNALKTVMPEMLYAALQNESEIDHNVGEVMNSWVSQPGYPILSVNVASDRKHIIITQKRFLQNDSNHQDKTRWHVPLSYASNKENSNFSVTKPFTLLSNYTLHINLSEPVDWIIFNVQQTGYYRVNYDDQTWSAIANVLHKSHNSIHVLNRAQIIDDALKIASNSYLSYEKALHIIQYLQNETDYIPWKAAFDNFEFILSRFKPDEARIFEEFELKLLSHVYEYLGFQQKFNDNRLDIYNRMNVLKHACQLGHKQCIANARIEFDNLSIGNYTIPVDLTPIVYCSVIEHGSDKEWIFLWNKFKSSNVHSEKSAILKALGCTKQPNLLKRYLDLILMSDEIRLQDKIGALESTLFHRQNLPLVIDFTITKYNEIDTVFETESGIPKILSIILSKITTDGEINRIQKFLNETKLESKIIVKNAMEKARLNLQWSSRNVPAIKNFIQGKKSEKSGKSGSSPQAAITCLIFFSVISIAFYQ